MKEAIRRDYGFAVLKRWREKIISNRYYSFGRYTVECIQYI